MKERRKSRMISRFMLNSWVVLFKEMAKTAGRAGFQHEGEEPRILCLNILEIYKQLIIIKINLYFER